MNTTLDIQQPFVGSVLSGKGGVGKSMATINIAASLKRSGYRVAIIDADHGLADCATMLNEHVDYSVHDWIQGDCHLDDLLLETNAGSLVTVADEPEHASLDIETTMQALDQIILHLKESHDIILIDTPAGAGEMVLWALDASDLGILVLVDEPAAISDVYRLCKYVYQIDPGYRFANIVNFAGDEASANQTQKQFNHILNYFLKKQSRYLGFIPYSKEVKESVQQQEPVATVNNTGVTSELDYIAQQLIAEAVRSSVNASGIMN